MSETLAANTDALSADAGDGVYLTASHWRFKPALGLYVVKLSVQIYSPLGHPRKAYTYEGTTLAEVARWMETTLDTLATAYQVPRRSK